MVPAPFAFPGFRRFRVRAKPAVLLLQADVVDAKPALSSPSHNPNNMRYQSRVTSLV